MPVTEKKKLLIADDDETLHRLYGDSFSEEFEVLHAFDGAAKHAVRAADELGYYFSIPPSVVRSPQKQKLVKRLPLASLLLETDSPVLGPEPGARNEPANIAHAAQFIAETKRQPLAEVIAKTTANACILFGDRILIS